MQGQARAHTHRHTLTHTPAGHMSVHAARGRLVFFLYKHEELRASKRLHTEVFAVTHTLLHECVQTHTPILRPGHLSRCWIWHLSHSWRLGWTCFPHSAQQCSSAERALLFAEFPPIWDQIWAHLSSSHFCTVSLLTQHFSGHEKVKDLNFALSDLRVFSVCGERRWPKIRVQDGGVMCK